MSVDLEQRVKFSPKSKRSMRFLIGVFKFLYRPLVRKSARQILEGRLLDLANPEKGRWLRSDVNHMLVTTWSRVDELLEQEDLSKLPTIGNRHNVFLAIVTTAAYQVLIERDLSPDYGASLIADVGWKVYKTGAQFISLPFRISSKNANKRIDRTIRTLLRFPFSAPGRPGYEVKVWNKNGNIYTHWTWCPPQTFVRDLIERNGDRGELDAFYQSWCLYDWPVADLIAGDGKKGHYTRGKTLSKGDNVCDMCWIGEISKKEQNNG